LYLGGADFFLDDDPEESLKFVDVKACLDNYSWKVIRRALPPPVRTTITVQLLRFVPGTNPDVEDAESHIALPKSTVPAPKSTPQRASGSPNDGMPTASSSGARSEGPSDTPALPIVRRVRLRVKGDSGEDPSDAGGPSTPQEGPRLNGLSTSPIALRAPTRPAEGDVQMLISPATDNRRPPY
jgi:hypothetical protein